MRNKLMIVGLIPCLLTACNWSGNKVAPAYETVVADPNRDTESARRQTAQAKALMEEGDYAQAESVLRAALEADLFYGPAHNNLGAAYYRQKKLYLAAWEFQYAANLMPNRPQPKNNLGMVLEDVGRTEEAQENYAAAMSLEPDNAEFIGNLARCRIRGGQRTPETRDLLQQLLLKDTRPQWVQWARRELMNMP